MQTNKYTYMQFKISLLTTAFLALLLGGVHAQKTGNGTEFITLWDTNKPATEDVSVNGTVVAKSSEKQIWFPGIGSGYELQYRGVNEDTWHDVDQDPITTQEGVAVQITFPSAGQYYVKAGPDKFTGFRMSDDGDMYGDAQRLVRIVSWGTVQWAEGGLASAFESCENLVALPLTNDPDFGANAKTALKIGGDLGSMFSGCRQLCEKNADGEVVWNLTTWDVSEATSTYWMFANCEKFNADLSTWQMGNVTNTSAMFQGCPLFNGNLSAWNVGKVLKTFGMFQGCTAFNGDLSKWNVSSVKFASDMFAACTSFNSDLSGWDVSNVTSATSMFQGCTAFNADLSGWNVSKVMSFEGMFGDCTSFNADLSAWNVASATNLRDMFKNCTAFNCPLGNWMPTNIISGDGMFTGSGLTPENWDHLLIGWASLADMADVNANVKIGATGVKHTARSEEAINALKTKKNWQITDAGLAGSPYTYSQPTQIVANPGSISLEVGDVKQIKDLVAINYTPAEPTYKNLYWTVDDPTVATVTPAGTVKVLSTGATNLKATTLDGAATLTVTLTVGTATTYKLIFNAKGGVFADGKEIFETTVAEGHLVTAPNPAPKKARYVLEGWYTSEDYATKFTFGTAISSDLTLYAKWTPRTTCTVILHSNGGKFADGTDTQTLTVNIDETLNLDAHKPTRKDHKVAGWYADALCQTPYTPAPVVDDLELWVKWDLASTFAVSFYANKGTWGKKWDEMTEVYIDIVEWGVVVEEGQKVVLPPEPTREDYRFAGWYLDTVSFSVPFDHEKTIHADEKVYAKWEQTMCTLTFHANYGKFPSGESTRTVKVQIGTPAAKPAKPEELPTRSGMKLVGWGKTTDGKPPYDFSTPVTGNLTLYAVWEKDGDDKKLTPVEDPSLTLVRVAPSPFSSSLTLLNTQPDTRYAVYTASGALVASGICTSQTSMLDTQDWPAGLYIVQLTTPVGIRTIRAVKR